MSMQPLQIDCRIHGAWLPPAHGPHLDGLVGAALVEQSVSATARAREGGAQVEPVDYDSVLAQLGEVFARHEPSGVWCASMFVPVGWMGSDRRMIVGKTDTEEMALLSHEGLLSKFGGNTIDTVRGIAKNAQVFFSVEFVLGLRAWCIGEPDALQELLDEIPAVGVKTRIGLGTVLPDEDGHLWRITSCPEAAERWKYRSSPVKLIEDSYPAVGTCHPPYWRDTRTPIYRPYPIREPAPPMPQPALT